MLQFAKQPAEMVEIGIDFTNRFPTGVSLAGHTAACSTAGIVVDSRISGMQVLATVAGGVDRTRYKIEFSASGDDGSVRHGEIMLEVRDL